MTVIVIVYTNAPPRRGFFVGWVAPVVQGQSSRAGVPAPHEHCRAVLDGQPRAAGLT